MMHEKRLLTECFTVSIAYIAVGSNLGNRLENCREGLYLLQESEKIQLKQVSSFYQNPAWALPGTAPQADYVNAVAALETQLDAMDLLTLLLETETRCGRKRSVRWAARTLDLDLLLFDQLTWHTPRLQLPHPRMRDRAFVIAPLHQIAPDLQFPDGTHINHLLAALDTTAMQPVS